MNSREKLNVRITNYWRFTDNHPDWDKHEARRLTPRQAIDLYDEYHPPGSSHYTAFEAIDKRGKNWTVEQLRAYVAELDAGFLR